MHPSLVSLAKLHFQNLVFSANIFLSAFQTLKNCNVTEKHIYTLGRYKKSRKLYSISFQPAFTCSKLTIETLKQGVKYVQS